MINLSPIWICWQTGLGVRVVRWRSSRTRPVRPNGEVSLLSLVLPRAPEHSKQSSLVVVVVVVAVRLHRLMRGASLICAPQAGPQRAQPSSLSCRIKPSRPPQTTPSLSSRLVISERGASQANGAATIPAACGSYLALEMIQPSLSLSAFYVCFELSAREMGAQQHTNSNRRKAGWLVGSSQPRGTSSGYCWPEPDWRRPFDLIVAGPVSLFV